MPITPARAELVPRAVQRIYAAPLTPDGWRRASEVPAQDRLDARINALRSCPRRRHLNAR